MKALEISNLKKTYKNGCQVLNGINFSVAKGDFFALLGQNGAGKSTTIGIATSLVKKTAGQIKIFGLDIDTDPIKIKSLIGVVPQEVNFSQFENPLEILVNQGGFYGIDRKISYERAEEFLTHMQLWEKRYEPSRTLSGGLKRRLMIARALIHKPKLLFLDEPTAGVDVELRRSMWDFLVNINKAGTTIILTTHYLEEAENLCRNIAIIDNGNIIADTTMKSLLSNLNVETFVLDLESPQENQVKLEDYNYQLVDASTLEIDICKQRGLNDLFQQLCEQNIKVLSIRNKSSRLEELFLNLLENKDNQP